jgi:Na+/phosphate symporter
MLPVLLVRIPVILVWLTAIILAIVFWNRHPKVSLLTIISVIGLMITSVFGTFLSMWLPLSMQNRGFNASRIAIRLGIWNIALTIIETFFWALLVAAIFGWRNKRPPVL